MHLRLQGVASPRQVYDQRSLRGLPRGHSRGYPSTGPTIFTAPGHDLQRYQTGVDELILSHGNERHTLKQGFGPGPTLTAFLNTHLNAGTLIVATTENNVRILVNGRE